MRDSTIGVFVDIISIHKNTRRLYDAKLDYRAYLDRISKEGRIYRAFAYGAQINNEAKKFISFLRQTGFDVKYCKAKDDVVHPENLLRTLQKVFDLEDNDQIFDYLRKKVNTEEPIVNPSVQQTDRMMDMITDILRLVDKLETVVIGTSNPRIIPFVRYLKEEGVKVIVFACGIPRSLKDESDQWWEITENFLEEEKEPIEEKVEA